MALSERTIMISDSIKSMLYYRIHRIKDYRSNLKVGNVNVSITENISSPFAKFHNNVRGCAKVNRMARNLSVGSTGGRGNVVARHHVNHGDCRCFCMRVSYVSYSSARMRERAFVNRFARACP